MSGALQLFHQAVQRLSAARIEALRRNALLDDGSRRFQVPQVQVNLGQVGVGDAVRGPELDQSFQVRFGLTSLSDAAAESLSKVPVAHRLRGETKWRPAGGRAWTQWSSC